MPGMDLLSLVVLTLLFLSLHNLSPLATASDGQFLYAGFAGSNLSVDGAARIITPGGLLQLSSGVEAVGHAFHPTPLHLSESRSFSACFVFGIVSGYSVYSPHGITFFLSRSKNFSDATGDQFLGLLNEQTDGNASNHIFAVELDTMLNPEFKDINDNHVGININSLVSVESRSAGYYYDNGTFQNMTMINGEAMQVWIDYDGSDHQATQINVTLAPLKMAKPMRPLLSVTYDLSTVLTAEVAYAGFSSATGPVSTRHYILGWSFAMNGVPAPGLPIDKLPQLPRPRTADGISPSAILLITVAAFVVVAVGLTVFFLVRRRIKYGELQEDWEVEFGPHRFSFQDLFCATGGFTNRNLLGKGGFGTVYKGVLPKSKLEVAVKKVSHDSKQGIREFISEVVSIGRLRHRNIVQLLGYCRRRKSELLLVYDYMPNGSLDKYLYGSSSGGGERPSLDWVQRLGIIKGVASGLLYLHGEWEQVVIHRDVKASNVLLDEDMNGRLGDFGLARLYDHGTDMQTTHLAGTIGYLAPELLRTGKASPSTDVFAFGVFALEAACGRKPIDHKQMHSNQLMLVDWVLALWRDGGSITEAMDPRLQDGGGGGGYDVDQACLVLKLGLLCSHPSAAARPSMWHVRQYLNHDLPFPELSPVDIMVQTERIDSLAAYYQQSSMASNATMSGLSLSGGR